jgi:hypothetical protein
MDKPPREARKESTANLGHCRAPTVVRQGKW